MKVADEGGFIADVFRFFRAADEDGDWQAEGEVDAFLQSEAIRHDGVFCLPDNLVVVDCFGGEEMTVGEGFHGENADAALLQDGDGVGDETVFGRGIDDADGKLASEQYRGFVRGAFEQAQVRIGTRMAGETDVADLTLPAGLERFGEDAAVETRVDVSGGFQCVQLPEVDDVGLEARERTFDAGARGGGILGVRFGHEENLRAVFGREIFPIAFLAGVRAVGFGRVEEPHALGERRFNGGLGERFGRPADVITAEAEAGDFGAVATELALGKNLADGVG